MASSKKIELVIGRGEAAKGKVKSFFNSSPGGRGGKRRRSERYVVYFSLAEVGI